jgi:hypothetical protein
MSRSFRHWTARYVFNRCSAYAYQRTHPHHPWLTRRANAILTDWLRPSHTGLEYGSGRSTLWFARRVASLTSVEHDRHWYDLVSARLKVHGIRSVRYILCEADCEEENAESAGYVRAGGHLSEGSLDFVLVDGIYRSHCALLAVERLKPGGLLIVDDVHRYLPSRSHAPFARRAPEGALSPQWERFRSTVDQWPCTWTTNGVTDTALWIKPGGLPGREGA